MEVQIMRKASVRAEISAPRDRNDRTALIRQQLESVSGGYFVLYRGAYRELPVIQVPVDLPVYRADSGRLMFQVRELCRDRNLPGNWYSENQETGEVQQVLHGMLYELSHDSRGPIHEELRRQGQQTEPMVITSDGVVVNGNRRLAAMRELRARDPARYASFEEIRAAVLPEDADVNDIEYLESALQLAPDTKLAYSWINRRLKIRRQLDQLHLPVDRICEAYRIDDAGQLQRELDELTLAEAYLAEYRDEPGHYSLIEDAEDLFAGLSRQLTGLDPDLKEVWRAAGFAMVDSRDSLDDDLPDLFPFSSPDPDYGPRHALYRLAEEKGLLVGEDAGESGTALSGPILTDLRALLHNRDRAGEPAGLLADHLRQLRAEHRERMEPRRVVRKIQQARRILERTDPGNLPRRYLVSLRSEIAAIELISREMLDRKPASGDSIDNFGYASHPRLRDALVDLVKVLLGRRLSRRIERRLRRDR